MAQRLQYSTRHRVKRLSTRKAIIAVIGEFDKSEIIPIIFLNWQ